MIRRLLRPDAGLVARVAMVAWLVVSTTTSNSCTSACGLALVSRFWFTSAAMTPTDAPHPVPCCGGVLFQDVNLGAADIQQVDLSNAQVNSGHVDGFLVAPDCTRLFDGPYNGTVVQPLCTIYMGPVASGTVGQRQTIPPGSYRMLAQAWATNEAADLFSLDVGVYSDKCRPNLTAP